ncbi:MAG: ABC-F family ATP-binding cassette domain-containing protein [Lentisphaeria bacterium]|nr:ABC-F family ATP-binding cassette domain-containing protein [Lentisphaeria bacterium]
MTVLTTEKLEKYYGGRLIFKGLNLQINDQDRVGLIGPNGQGKTTLLKILTNEEPASGGIFSLTKGKSMAYLPQIAPEMPNLTLKEFVDQIFTKAQELEEQLEKLTEQLTSTPENLNIQERYNQLQNQLDMVDPYRLEAEMHRVLDGLGFEKEDLQKQLQEFSGGWRTRAWLARMLLEKPDLLVLDEPTNHLDISTVDWLEGFLANWPTAILIVSHDRYFLNRVCTHIWNLEQYTLQVFKGNYDQYLTVADENFLQRMRTWEQQQEYIEKTQDFIRKHIAGQRTKEAQGRRKHLERFLKDEAIEKPVKNVFKMNLSFDQLERTGDQTLRFHDLAVGYNGEKLLDVPNTNVLRGDRLAIIGDNGTGKSTIIKTIVESIPAISGNYEWGSNVELGYLSQGHENLDRDLTLIDTIRTVQDIKSDEGARNLLGALNFRDDDVFKKVGDLSGGERTRLSLAMLVLKGVNVLVLDEPTNHLDIPSKDALQELLQDYTGTVIFVSHDRYLIQNFASTLMVLQKGVCDYFEGTWHEYLAHQNKNATKQVNVKTEVSVVAEDKEARKEKLQQQKKAKNELQRQERRFQELEKGIQTQEGKLEEVQVELDAASESMNLGKVQELSEQYQSEETNLQSLYEEWETLAESIEELKESLIV